MQGWILQPHRSHASAHSSHSTPRPQHTAACCSAVCFCMQPSRSPHAAHTQLTRSPTALPAQRASATAQCTLTPSLCFHFEGSCLPAQLHTAYVLLPNCPSTAPIQPQHATCTPLQCCADAGWLGDNAGIGQDVLLWIKKVMGGARKKRGLGLRKKRWNQSQMHTQT